MKCEAYLGETHRSHTAMPTGCSSERNVEGPFGGNTHIIRLISSTRLTNQE